MLDSPRHSKAHTFRKSLENPPKEPCSYLTTMSAWSAAVRDIYSSLSATIQRELCLWMPEPLVLSLQLVRAHGQQQEWVSWLWNPLLEAEGWVVGERTDGVSFLNEKFWHWPLSRAFPCFHLVLGPGTHTRESGKRKLCRRAKPLEKQERLPALPLSPRRPVHSAQGTLSCCL